MNSTYSCPEARNEDWQLYTGKHVQVIKDTPEHGKGFIQFGTEVVNSQDHTVIALLGESWGLQLQFQLR